MRLIHCECCFVTTCIFFEFSIWPLMAISLPIVSLWIWGTVARWHRINCCLNREFSSVEWRPGKRLNGLVIGTAWLTDVENKSPVVICDENGTYSFISEHELFQFLLHVHPISEDGKFSRNWSRKLSIFISASKIKLYLIYSKSLQKIRRGKMLKTVVAEVSWFNGREIRENRAALCVLTRACDSAYIR